MLLREGVHREVGAHARIVLPGNRAVSGWARGARWTHGGLARPGDDPDACSTTARPGPSSACPATRSRTAYSIARLLQERGKRIVPIHPDAPTVLGEQGYATLADVPFPIDVVDVFRRSEFGRASSPTRPSRRRQGRVVPARRDRPRGVRAHPGSRRPDGDGHLPGDRVVPAARVSAPGQRPRGDRPGPGLPDGLVIPAAELVERFSRSSGPGGQSVNTTDSRVELEYDVGVVRGAHRRPARPGAAQPRHAADRRPGRRRRLRAPLPAPQPGGRPRAAGRPAPRPRSRPRPRSAVRPSRRRRAQQRRLDAKKQRGQTKALRGRVAWPTDSRTTLVVAVRACRATETSWTIGSRPCRAPRAAALPDEGGRRAHSSGPRRPP